MSVETTEEYGGPAETKFSGEDTYNAGNPSIKKVSLFGYNKFNAMRITYSNDAVVTYGDRTDERDEHSIELEDGETITSVAGKANNAGIFQLSLKTSKRDGPKVGKGNHGKEFSVDFTSTDGGSGSLLYVFGTEDGNISSIGFAYGVLATTAPSESKLITRSRWYGRVLDEIFDHFAFTNNGEHQIKTIKGWYDESRLLGLGIMYDNGEWAGTIGKEHGDPVIFELGDGEYLTGVHMRGLEGVQALSFSTNKGRVSPMLGPYDDEKPTFDFFEENRTILALCGRHNTWHGEIRDLGVVYISGVISELKVLSMEYHVDRQKVINGKPSMVGRRYMKNKTKIEQEMQSSITHTSTKTDTQSTTSSFSKTCKFSIGGFGIMGIGLPVFGALGGGMGFETSKTWTNSNTTTTSVSKTTESTYDFKVRVQPDEIVEARAFAVESSVTIPYTMKAEVLYLGSITPVTKTFTGSYTSVSSSDMQMEYEYGVDGLLTT